MELRQVEYFVVLARHRSFTRAAAAAGVAQPALSQQVKRLEEELGVVLVDRTSRPVWLTEAGLAFHARAERMVTESTLAKEEMREFAGAGRGRLVVGALPTLAALWLPTVLGRFHAVHPGIGIVLREENTEELSRLLGTGQLDVALLHAVPGLYSGHAAHRGVVMERLFEEHFAVIVGARHALAARRSVELEELRDEPFVVLAHGSGLAHTVMVATTAHGFTPRIAAESSSLRTLRALVAAGIGVAIVPRLAARSPGPAVQVLELTPPLPSHTTAVAWRGDARLSGAAEALLGVIRAHVAGRAGTAPDDA